MGSDQSSSDSLRQEFEALASDCGAFFESLKDVTEKASAYQKETGNWRSEKAFLSAEQKQGTQDLQDRLVRLGNRLVPALESSPLLDASDVRVTRERLRAIRGAIRLEQHFHDDEHGVWKTYDSSLEQAQGSYRHLIHAVREVLPMLAPSKNQPPSAITFAERRRFNDTAQILPSS